MSDDSAVKFNEHQGVCTPDNCRAMKIAWLEGHPLALLVQVADAIQTRNAAAKLLHPVTIGHTHESESASGPA